LYLQYFTWFIPLIPAILPHVAISRTKAIVMIAAWVAGQAAWLGTAYQLEFLGASVHRTLWMAGLALMVISTWIIGEIIDAYRPRATLKDTSGVGGKVVAESTPPRRAVRRAVRG
jgi:phosphatidylinositol glycan class M